MEEQSRSFESERTQLIEQMEQAEQREREAALTQSHAAPLPADHENFSASAEELERLLVENREQNELILQLQADFEHIRKTFGVQLQHDKDELLAGQKLNQSLHESYEDVKHVAKVHLKFGK